jgi:hypothetical protein
MAITWFRTRKTTRTAAPAAGIGQPRGRHARPALGAPVAYDAGYDHPGWDGAERELLMPAIQGPPWSTDEGTVREALTALRGTGLDGPDLAELTLVDKPLAVLRPETAPERAEPGPDLAAAPQDRPYVPQEGGPPSAWLRAVPQSGPGGRVLETLSGLPFYAGTRHGTGAEGICLGAADDIFLIMDTQSAGVLDALEAAVREARENRVYGGFRAPAVQPDPDAAEHVETLERELDACDAAREDALEQAADEAGEGIETAQSVLRAAGNLGFLSAALRQRDGEGVMDVFVARAALANAIESGGGETALRAAQELVDTVSDLCGEEAACAIANGIVPSGEAVARAGDAPEPEAADEPEAAVSGDGPADGQDGTAAA